jgi:hypothetical protein
MSSVYRKARAFLDFPIIYEIGKFYFENTVFIVCFVVGANAGSDCGFHLLPLFK